jgi:hypothetical protein
MKTGGKTPQNPQYHPSRSTYLILDNAKKSEGK